MHNHNQSNCALIPTRGPGVVRFDHAPTKNVEQLVFEPPRAQPDLISRAVRRDGCIVQTSCYILCTNGLDDWNVTNPSDVPSKPNGPTVVAHPSSQTTRVNKGGCYPVVDVADGPELAAKTVFTCFPTFLRNAGNVSKFEQRYWFPRVQVQTDGSKLVQVCSH